MSKLLKELTDEEVEKTLSNGGAGANCAFYNRMLPIYIASCMGGTILDRTCGCDEMQYATEYLHKYC